MIPEPNVSVAAEFEIGKEEVTVFLLNQAFDEGMLDEEKFLYCLHAENNNLVIT